MPFILIVWIGTGIVRVLLGSSTSPVAYVFFGFFWLVSVSLLMAAIRQLVIPVRAAQKRNREKVASFQSSQASMTANMRETIEFASPPTRS